jgi:hypothetical protein
MARKGAAPAINAKQSDATVIVRFVIRKKLILVGFIKSERLTDYRSSFLLYMTCEGAQEDFKRPQQFCNRA